MNNHPYQCRDNCGACCIAPSISSAIPNMPNGKPAGIPCCHLDSQNRCKLFGQSNRPLVCANLKANPEMCGKNRQEALDYLSYLEQITC